MADLGSSPLISSHSWRTIQVLGSLFMYSTAMFTLPFIVFFGVRHALTEYYPVDAFVKNVWSVVAAVVVVNLIIGMYAIKAYKEKEYDDDGNEVDQHHYDSQSLQENKSSLNKQD